MIRLSEKTIKALTWLRDNVDKVMRFAKDFDRVANKVDTMKGAGDVQVVNPARGSVVIGIALKRGTQLRPLAMPYVLFRVTLTQTGGSAGNKTTAVSFTYTVTSLAGAELATGKAPEWPSRSENGLKVAATQGLAYYDANGTIQIAIAFERSGTGGC